MGQYFITADDILYTECLHGSSISEHYFHLTNLFYYIIKRYVFSQLICLIDLNKFCLLHTFQFYAYK